jgi:carboxylesterase type B
VHAAELPYVFGPSITPFINSHVDIALSKSVQKAWLSFAAHLNPNALGYISPGISWPQYRRNTEEVLVFQTTDGNQGPVGQGLHTEKDKDDRPACAFIIAKDLEFVR